MSNIYDALEKSKGKGAAPAPPAEPMAPLLPRASGAPGIPITGHAERDAELESLRQRILLEVEAGRSVAVTFAGAVPGEGASTLALLFARDLAEAEGRPVLLVDADISGQSRSLTGVLKSDEVEGAGFGELLEGTAILEDVVRATEQANLHFLPRGITSGAPMELLAAERMRRFLNEAGKHYAFVVLDAAPVLHSPETGLLASGTEGVVLVVRANRTRREIVQRAVRLLNQARCRTFGVVLNDRRYPIPAFIYRRL